MVSRQIDKDQSVIRVYKYGLVPKSPFPDEAVAELWRTNKLWNKFVEIHQQSQIDFEAARRDASQHYKEIDDIMSSLNADIDAAFTAKRMARKKAGSRDETHPLLAKANAKITSLRADRSELYVKMKPIRQEADKLIDKPSLNKLFDEQLKIATKVKNSGIFRDTADAINADFRTARERVFKSNNSRLRFHRFDGTGYFNLRFRRKGAKTDGISFSELFVGNEGTEKNNKRLVFLSRDDSHKKPRLRMRTTLAGGQKKSEQTRFEFDMIYHRPIPDDGQIQNGKIIRSRTGDKFTYHLVLTVKFPLKPAPSIPEGKAVGIDLGFRLRGDTIQVAAIASTDTSQSVQTISAPVKMIKANQHILDIQSDMDESATELGSIIQPLFKAHPLDETHQNYRLWKSVANMAAHVTLSFETAYKVARKSLFSPGQFSDEAEKHIEKWWRSNSRRYREMHNLRRKHLAHRKAFYRQIASDLVARKTLIVLETLPLNKFADVKDVENKLSNKARKQRVLGAPSEFRDAIINAAKREQVPHITIPPQNTSKRCSSCGVINKSLASEKEWTCPNCGTLHDRDDNAARNIAQIGLKTFEKQKLGAKNT